MKKKNIQDHQSPYEKYIQNYAFTGQTGAEAYGSGATDQYSSNSYSDRGGGGGSGGNDYSDRGNSRG